MISADLNIPYKKGKDIYEQNAARCSGKKNLPFAVPEKEKRKSDFLYDS